MAKEFEAEKVEAVILEVAERNGTPTFQAVRAAMKVAKLTGSNTNVLDAIQEWKRNHVLHWSAEDAGTPVVPQKRRNGAKAAPVDDVTQQAASMSVTEFIRLMQLSGDLAERLALVEERLQVLETDDDRLLDRVGAANRRRTHRREFWDRVMTAASGILQEHGNRGPHDVLEMMPGSLFEEAKRIGVTLDTDTLSEKMGGR